MEMHEQLANTEQQFLLDRTLAYVEFFETVIGGWQNLGATIWEATEGVRVQEREKFDELQEMYEEGRITAAEFEESRVNLSKAANEESRKIWRQFGANIITALTDSIGKILIQQGLAMAFGAMAQSSAAAQSAIFFQTMAATWATIAAVALDPVTKSTAATTAGAYQKGAVAMGALAGASAAGSVGGGIGLAAVGAGIMVGGGFAGTAVGAGGPGGFGDYEHPTGEGTTGGRSLGSVVGAREMHFTIAPVTNIIVEDGVLVIGNKASLEELEGTLDELVAQRVKEGFETGEFRG